MKLCDSYPMEHAGAQTGSIAFEPMCENIHLYQKFLRKLGI